MNYTNVTNIILPQAMASIVDVAQLLALLDPRLSTTTSPVEEVFEAVRTNRDFVFFHIIH